MIDQAFLLCAGKATRMWPTTKTMPKCLLDVAGKPALTRMLNWLKANGVKRVVMNLSHRYEAVLDHLAAHDYGMHVHCTVEFGSPLGTAGGVRNAFDYLDDRFVVVYGDIITNMNLRRLCDIHEKIGPQVSMATYKAPNPRECGVVYGPTGWVEEFVEKPKSDVELKSDLVNTGVLVCEKSVFRDVPLTRPSDISKDVLPEIVERHALYHQPINEAEYLFDIGTRANYDRCYEVVKASG